MAREREIIAARKALRQQGHKRVRTSFTDAQRIAKAEVICQLYAEGEYSLASCCEAVGVDYPTFQAWNQPNLTESDISSGKMRPGFVRAIHDLYKEAKKENEVNYIALLKNKAREGLLVRASGGELEEVTTEYRKVEPVAEEGKETPQPFMELVTEKRVKKKHLPDTTALIFISKNLDKENFQDKQIQEHTGVINVESELARKTDAELQELKKKIAKEKDSPDGM